MTQSVLAARFSNSIRVVIAFGALSAVAGSFSPAVLAQSSRNACISGSGASGAAACEQAVRNNPDDADLYVAWVDRLLQAAQIGEADGVLQQALGRFPSDVQLRSRVAVIKSHLAEQEFMQERKQARASSSRSAAMARRDQLKCTRSTGDAALTACNRLLEDDSSDSEVLARKALILVQLGRLSEATKTIQLARQAGAGASALRSVERMLASKKPAQKAAPVVVAKASQPATAPKQPAKSTQQQAKPARVLAAVERKLFFDARSGAFRLR